MSVITNDDPKPQLKLMTGGKGSKNWLWNLPIGTVFLTRDAGTVNHGLLQFQICARDHLAVLLMQPNFTNQPPVYGWVDSVKFSAGMEQYLIQALGVEDVSDDGNEEGD